MRVALLAGGTGGAKLAAGLAELVGDELSVIVNTADDCEVHGLHVSPDPDLVTYWLSGEIDEQRGWGIGGDSFVVHERLARLGAPDWFSLSDRDLAACLYRTHFIAEGGTLTRAQAQIAAGLGVAPAVLPMSEEPVATYVRTPAGRRALQQFLIIDEGRAPIEGVEVEGLERARPTEPVLEALAGAEAIVLGPSNPVISIGPILSVPGMRDAVGGSPAPVIAVSPIVAGEVVKGPTRAFIEALGLEASHAGVASLYQGLLDAMLLDGSTPSPRPDEGVELRETDLLMSDRASRARLGEEVLELARELA